MDSPEQDRIDLKTPTGDVELWASGAHGDVGLAVTGTTPRTDGQRIWVALTPYQSLQIAAHLIRCALAAVIVRPHGFMPPASNALTGSEPIPGGIPARGTAVALRCSVCTATATTVVAESISPIVGWTWDVDHGWRCPTHSSEEGAAPGRRSCSIVTMCES